MVATAELNAAAPRVAEAFVKKCSSKKSPTGMTPAKVCNRRNTNSECFWACATSVPPFQESYQNERKAYVTAVAADCQSDRSPVSKVDFTDCQIQRQGNAVE